MIARLLGAIQFLTVVPVKARTAALGKSSVFFPLVGAALGFAGGWILEIARGFIPWTLSALLVLCFWALITGGLHEDAFADCADAFRAYRSPEKIREILKDSRVGAHGALALILVSLVRWQALAAIASDPVRGLTGVFSVSRASVVALAWMAPPAGSGSGMEFSRTLSTPIAIAAILQAGIFALWSGAGLLLFSGAAIIVLTSRRYFEKRIGGVTGDCLGMTAFLVETWGLILFTCQRCM